MLSQLIQVTWLSLDPAMRGWLNNTRSYLPPVQIGEVRTGHSCSFGRSCTLPFTFSHTYPLLPSFTIIAHPPLLPQTMRSGGLGVIVKAGEGVKLAVGDVVQCSPGALNFLPRSLPSLPLAPTYKPSFFIRS